MIMLFLLSPMPICLSGLVWSMCPINQTSLYKLVPMLTVKGGSDRGDATVSNADGFKPSRSHVPGDNVCKSDRLRKACPLCGKRVLFLPRHMRSKVHRWTGSKAKAVIQQYGLRKQYTYKSMESAFKNKSRKSSLTDNTQKPFRDYHRYRRCPLPNCGSIVKRMSPHLTNVHKIQPKSRLLTHYLNKVRVAQCNALDEEDEISMEEEMETAIKEVATVQNGNVSTSSPAADDDDDDIEMESMSGHRRPQQQPRGNCCRHFHHHHAQTGHHRPQPEPRGD